MTDLEKRIHTQFGKNGQMVTEGLRKLLSAEDLTVSYDHLINGFLADDDDYDVGLKNVGTYGIYDEEDDE